VPTPALGPLEDWGWHKMGSRLVVGDRLWAEIRWHVEDWAFVAGLGPT
jgi:hypothetical protein